MAIAALLEVSPSPTDEQIDALPNICRCGAYPRIRKAIARAAATVRTAQNPEQTAPKQLSSGSSAEEHNSSQ
jgi:isoquinoline 1-oxidoreductase alpha subunit